MIRIQAEIDRLAACGPDPARIRALQRILPRRRLQAFLRAQAPDRRACPRLPGWFMLWFVVALGLFATDCYRQVYRWLMPRRARPPARSSLCAARQRLGVAPLRRLAEQVLVPLATPDTPGAFYRGLRLLAIDGFTLNAPDSSANAATFRYPANQRGRAAFPQVRVVALCEAGTHALLGWVLKPGRRSESKMAPVLLRRLTAGCLLLWDRHYFSYDHVAAVLARQSQLVGRLARSVKPRLLRPLPDGSYRAQLRPTHRSRDRRAPPLPVRVIRYRLADPARGEPAQEHRLITTLLDERAHPAAALVELYHRRWEEELAIGEVKTHLSGRPVLRSRTPAGVVQEVYGLLLGHYLVRCLMAEAARQAGQDPRRLSFTGAVTILRCRLAEVGRGRGGARGWLGRLREEVGEEVLPPRRDRVNRREVKRPRVKWPAKRRGAPPKPQPTRPFREVIVLLC